MKRFHPVVRALCDRVRRPVTKQIVAGLLLTTPAGMLYLRGGQAGEKMAPIELPAVTVASAAHEANVLDAAAYAQEFEIPASLARDIVEAAAEADIAPRTALGLVRAESSFRTSAVSPVGAVGLTQLMPATARWLEPGITRQELKNPETNLRIGFRYLRQLIDKYDGDEQLALTAFNRGPGTVDRLLKRGRNPDNGYAEKVLTGRSKRHVRLMNAKFGRRRS
ncbi:MAG: lytic transglycosylase domain-containing protein [Gemmatimonadota bacterium]